MQRKTKFFEGYRQ